MGALAIAIAGLMVLLAFEIRHRMIILELAGIKTDVLRFDKEILGLKEELKKKKNIYEEYKPPA